MVPALSYVDGIQPSVYHRLSLFPSLMYSVIFLLVFSFAIRLYPSIPLSRDLFGLSFCLSNYFFFKNKLFSSCPTVPVNSPYVFFPAFTYSMFTIYKYMFFHMSNLTFSFKPVTFFISLRHFSNFLYLTFHDLYSASARETLQTFNNIIEATRVRCLQHSTHTVHTYFQMDFICSTLQRMNLFFRQL